MLKAGQSPRHHLHIPVGQQRCCSTRRIADSSHEQTYTKSFQSVDSFKSGQALYKRMREESDQFIKDKVRHALDVVEQALRLYGPNQVFGSYNGGKDAVVVTHLLRAAVANFCTLKSPSDCSDNSPPYLNEPVRPRLIYFSQQREFPEVVDLVKTTSEQFDLDLTVYENMTFASGLEACIANEGGKPLAFCLGTRKGDPNCKDQETFAPSSTWMPPFMRVNPILDWQYGHVWHFLRHYELPYCQLYDQGYTSLGNIHNTLPNPALAKEDGSLGYHPAYMLSDWSLERAGRFDRKQLEGSGVKGKGIEEERLECELRDLEGKRQRTQDAKTAGLVIIGDEILKGKTPDSNSVYAARRLRENGIQVKRITILSDEHDAIAAEVRDQVHRFDVVITSGGVGPTHDDVTTKSVADALGQGLHQNADITRRLQKAYGLRSPEQLTEGQRKMTMLPDLALLRTAPGGNQLWPILQCENVFILPGVPQFFEQKIDTIVRHFLGQRPLFTIKIVLTVDEIEIVDVLNGAVESYNQHVVFGSYPYFFGQAPQRTVITLESQLEDQLELAKAYLLERLPKRTIVAISNHDRLVDKGGDKPENSSKSGAED